MICSSSSLFSGSEEELAVSFATGQKNEQKLFIKFSQSSPSLIQIHAILQKSLPQNIKYQLTTLKIPLSYHSSIKWNSSDRTEDPPNIFPSKALNLQQLEQYRLGFTIPPTVMIIASTLQ